MFNLMPEVIFHLHNFMLRLVFVKTYKLLFVHYAVSQAHTREWGRDRESPKQL